MITLWFLALLGIAINFLAKYNNRKDRKNFDFKYWIEDNWPESTQAVLWVVALMIMVMSPEAVFDFQKLYDKLPLPASIQLPAKMLASFLIGLGCTEITYQWNKRKAKWAKANN